MIRIPYEEDSGNSRSDGEWQLPGISDTVREQGCSRQTSTDDNGRHQRESGVNNNNNRNETYQSFEHENETELSETNEADRSSVDVENLTDYLNIAEV
jgi:hypothetical protein